MDPTKAFTEYYNTPGFPIELVSKATNMTPDAIRKWPSRSKIKTLDAQVGVRGRRVLFSPADLLQLLVASRFSHAHISFKGDSPIERKITTMDGVMLPVERWTLDDEIRTQIVGNIRSIIFDWGKIAGGASAGIFNSDPSDVRYFVVYFDHDLAQTVNGKKINAGQINFKATSDPLSLDKNEGLIVIIDCFLLAKIALDAVVEAKHYL